MMFDDVAMPVPAQTVGSQIQRDKTDARFDQAAGQQPHLAPAVTAVAVTSRRRFFIQLEGFAGLAADHHIERGPAELIELGYSARCLVELPRKLLQRLQQRLSIFDAV